MGKEAKLYGISGWFVKLMGWKVIEEYDRNIRKLVYAVVPHTSNWDFILGVIVRKATRFKAYFVGKHTLFFFPLGVLMRWLGGIPINRSKSKNFVDAVVELFNSREELTIGIAPEGTRKKVNRLKSGYYFIAKGAGVPIVPVIFDWANKQVVFQKAFYPSEDSDADLATLNTLFSGHKGKVVEHGFVHNVTED